MSKKLRLQKGEIATILTIVSLVVLGASTLVSSVFLSKNKQTTSTKATGSTKCCRKSSGCYGYPDCSGKSKQRKIILLGSNYEDCSKTGYSDAYECSTSGTYCVYDNVCPETGSSSQPTATKTPIPKVTTSSCLSGQCNYFGSCVSRGTVKTFNYGSKARCCYPGTSSEWFYSSTSSDPPACSAAIAAPTATPTRVPGNELEGYENCNRCCIQDLQCGIPADGNGYKCGKDEIRIRWYSYNCTSSCSSFGSGALTKFIDCPSDVGRENRLKCVSGTGICSTYYGGAAYPTTASTTTPETAIEEITEQTTTPSCDVYKCTKRYGDGANNKNFYTKSSDSGGKTFFYNSDDCEEHDQINDLGVYCGLGDPTPTTILPSGITTYPTSGSGSCRATSKITVGGVECNDPSFGYSFPVPCGGILACSDANQGIFVYRQCPTNNNSQSECVYRCVKNGDDVNCKGGSTKDEIKNNFLSVYNNSSKDIILTNIGLFHVNNKGTQVYKSLSYTLQSHLSVSFDFSDTSVCSGGFGEIKAHVVYQISGDPASYNINSLGSDKCLLGLNLMVVIN